MNSSEQAPAPPDPTTVHIQRLATSIGSLADVAGASNRQIAFEPETQGAAVKVKTDQGVTTIMSEHLPRLGKSLPGLYGAIPAIGIKQVHGNTTQADPGSFSVDIMPQPDGPVKFDCTRPDGQILSVEDDVVTQTRDGHTSALSTDAAHAAAMRTRIFSIADDVVLSALTLPPDQAMALTPNLCAPLP